MRACYLPVFILLLLWHGLAGAADVSVALSPDDVSVDYRDGTYFASLILRVAVAPGVAQEVLTDFEHMAEFVPNLSSSRVLARTGNRYRITQQGTANFGPFSFHFESERQIEVLADGRILAQAISGSSKSMHSEMRIHSEGRGTRLEYRVEMVPEQWIPSNIGVNLLRHELAEQFSAISREMERRQRQRNSR
jgi:carbon monoxide dehydrogenase subunit G